MADEKTSGTPPGGGTTTSVASPAGDTRAPVTEADELTALREALKRTERERDEANVRADSGAQAVAAASRQVADTHAARLTAEEQALSTAIHSAESTIAQLEESLEIATQAGNSKQMAQAVRALSKETVRLETLNGYKFNLEQAKKAPPPQVRVNSTGAIDDNDARLNGFSPAIKEWVKRNPRFLTDKAFNKRVMQAHALAQAKGIQLESDEYFDFVEARKEVGPSAEEIDAADPLSEAARVETPSRGSSAAAAPSRGSPANGTRQTGRGPDLSPEEKEIAEASYDYLPNMADRYLAYAESRDALRKVGKVGTQH